MEYLRAPDTLEAARQQRLLPGVEVDRLEDVATVDLDAGAEEVVGWSSAWRMALALTSFGPPGISRGRTC